MNKYIIILFWSNLALAMQDTPAQCSHTDSRDITIHIDHPNHPRHAHDDSDDESESVQNNKCCCPKNVKIALITSFTSMATAAITAAITLSVQDCNKNP